MKKLTIIATAIALALPAIAVAEEAAVAVPAPAVGTVGRSLPPFDREKALRISPTQQPAYDAYVKAETIAWEWEAPIIGQKNGYIAAATDALDGLYKSGLSQQQLDRLLLGAINIQMDPQEYIDWRSKDIDLSKEQQVLFAQYVKAGSYKLQMDTEVSQNLLKARRALNAKLNANQLRIAYDYGLIDSRPAPAYELHKLQEGVK